MWHSGDDQQLSDHCLVLGESRWWDRGCSSSYMSVCQIMSSRQCQQGGLFHQMSALKETIAEARQETKGENEFSCQLDIKLSQICIVLFDDCYQT